MNFQGFGLLVLGLVAEASHVRKIHISIADHNYRSNEILGDWKGLMGVADKDQRKSLILESLNLQGAVLAIHNAKSLQKSAIALSNIEKFGPARSLLILASEEAVKAVVLFCQSIGLDLDPDGYDAFSISHHARLRFSKALITVARYAELAISKNSKEPSTETIVLEILTSLFQDIMADSLSPELRQERQWWSMANRFKQRGFYTDQIEGRWESPALVSRQEFESAFEYVDSLLIGARIAIAFGRREGFSVFQDFACLDFEKLASRLEIEFENNSFIDD